MITIAICTYNRAEMLDSALSSIEEQIVPNAIQFEILVIDDGSTDATTGVVAHHAARSQIQIRYIRQGNSGIAAARNRGVAESQGDWIAFFDDDQIATKDWLRRLIESAGGVDVVGGPCRLMLHQNAEAVIDSTVRRLLGENPYLAEERKASVPLVDPRCREAIPGTGNALVKKSLFLRVGLFSENTVYGEDLEFFRRAEAAGALFRIAPNALVYHVIPPSRLSVTYLLPLARRGGRSQAEIDAEICGMGRAFWNCLLRLSHVALWTLPRLVIAALKRDGAKVLGRRCSLQFALSYIGAVLVRTSEKSCAYQG
jgi:glycosyltransferase involved in cell wall biosynthesis